MHMTTRQRLEVHVCLCRLSFDSSARGSGRDSYNEKKSTDEGSGLAALEEGFEASHGEC